MLYQNAIMVLILQKGFADFQRYAAVLFLRKWISWLLQLSLLLLLVITWPIQYFCKSIQLWNVLFKLTHLEKHAEPFANPSDDFKFKLIRKAKKDLQFYVVPISDQTLVTQHKKNKKIKFLDNQWPFQCKYDGNDFHLTNKINELPWSDNTALRKIKTK